MDRMEFIRNIGLPVILMPFTGRKIWKSPLFTVKRYERHHGWILLSHLIKRARTLNVFHGTVITVAQDFIQASGGVDDIDVWCWEYVLFYRNGVLGA